MGLFDEINAVIPITQMKIEIISVMNTIASVIPRPKVMLEIGSYHGGSLALLGNLLAEDGLLISVEPELQVPLMVDEVRDFIAPRELVHIKEYSWDAVREVHEILDGRLINVLMIDGDHTPEGTAYDWELYRPLVSSPGVILLHDICDQHELGPTQVFYAQIANHETGIMSMSLHRQGIGIIYV